MHKFKSQLFIPSISSKTDLEIASGALDSGSIYKVSAEIVGSNIEISRSDKLWVDLSFDGFLNKAVYSTSSADNWPWRTWVQGFSDYDAVGNPVAKNHSKIYKFVSEILDSVRVHNPYAVSIPQLSHGAGAKSNKINKVLLSATEEWRSRNKTGMKFVLPVVLDGASAIDTPAKCRSKLKIIKGCLSETSVDAVWVVVAKLDDQSGVESNEQLFQKVIKFYAEINSILDQEGIPLVGGPYWGLGIIMWARGIIATPVVGCGTGYVYNTTMPYIGISLSTKISLPSLYRLYKVFPELDDWIKSVIIDLSAYKDNLEDYKKLGKEFSLFQSGEKGRIAAKRQVARFYFDWIQDLGDVPEAGRAITLYQQFSTALITGSQISSELPKAPGLSKITRRPGHIAQQLMLQCLDR